MEIRWLWKIFIISILPLSYGATQKVENHTESNANLTQNTSRSSPGPADSTSNTDKEEFVDNISNQPHSRRKRLIWITDDGRLALPPGMTLTMTPTIALPLVRHPLDGFLSNISISMPVTLDFDKLGLTDEQNPLGVLPPVFARSFGQTAGSLLGNYIANYMHYRVKRDARKTDNSFGQSDYFKINVDSDNLVEPALPDDYKHAFHGGERAILYGVIEDFLGTFGINGKACLLRTICEVHSLPMTRFGVFGEIVKLFLTATNSPYATYITDYVRAQEIGEGKVSPGECFPYYKDCPKGLFKVFQQHKYSDDTKSDVKEDDAENKNTVHQSYNEIESDILEKKLQNQRILSGAGSM